MSERRTKRIEEVLSTKPTLEGAGVRLHRGFANAEVPRFDPFLLFDDFSAKNPADYLPGFPWHPHRGMETVTYILDGDVRHRDSIGNSGVISAGDLQWMSAGSGIIHEEMPEGVWGVMGFQLWVNLPQKEKMSRPRYQEMRKNIIPEIVYKKNALVHIVAGEVDGVRGPIADVMVDPLYIDVTITPRVVFEFPLIPGNTSFIYLFSGSLSIPDGPALYEPGMILLFEREGDLLTIQGGGSSARFLLVSGKPLGESVAWRGPIVMNTEEELAFAFTELREGRFIK